MHFGLTFVSWYEHLSLKFILTVDEITESPIAYSRVTPSAVHELSRTCHIAPVPACCIRYDEPEASGVVVFIWNEPAGAAQRVVLGDVGAHASKKDGCRVFKNSQQT